MQNPDTIHPNLALAASRTAAYASNTFEHLFDMTGEVETDERQGQAETNPYPLTRMALAGAGNPVHTEDLIVTLMLLKQQFTAVASCPSVLESQDERADAALACARHALAHLAAPFDDLSVDDRCDIISEWFSWSKSEPGTEKFWMLLTNMLYRYVEHMMDLGWQPEPGFTPTDNPFIAMPVWRTESGYSGCDLLVSMSPWNTDEDIWAEVGPAMQAACAVFGGRFLGIRVVPPLTRYLTRWYYPDGSWEHWYEDVPNFRDLLDEALAEADLS